MLNFHKASFPVFSVTNLLHHLLLCQVSTGPTVWHQYNGGSFQNVKTLNKPFLKKNIFNVLIQLFNYVLIDFSEGKNSL